VGAAMLFLPLRCLIDIDMSKPDTLYR